MSAALQKRSLSGRLGWVTRAINDCESCLAQVPVDCDNLRVLIDVLKERWSKYEETYIKLEDCLIALKDTSQYDDESVAYEAQVDKYLSYLKKFEGVISSNKLTSSNPSTTSGHNPLPKQNLPVLTLPEFNGGDNWPSFWDKFKSLVHDSSNISDVNKFTYLLGQLKGPAYELISELPVIDDNYDVALQILKDNFDDKDLILKSQVYKLLDLPGPNHNLKELQSFRITLSCTLKALATRQDLDSAAWFINHVIQKKLPQKTCDDLYHKYGTNYFSYKQIEEGLRDICKHLQSTKKESPGPVSKGKEIASKESTKVKTPSVDKKVRLQDSGKVLYREEIGTYPTAVLEAGKQSVANNKSQITERTSQGVGARPKTHTYEGNKNCKFCSESHSAVNCKNYPDLISRLGRLKSLNSCLICLGKHKPSECAVKLNNCYKCNQEKHHAALCPRIDEEGHTGTKSTNVSLTLMKPPHTINSPAAVPTAEVKLTNGKQTKLVKTLFDTGAQKTFISRETACALEMPIVGKVNLAITGFLANSKPQTFDIVKPLVQLGKFKCRITAAVLDSMDINITTKGLKETAEFLTGKGVKLADRNIKSNTVGPINLILGSDYCGRFLQKMVRKHNVQLVTTAGGHLIMGPLPFDKPIYTKGTGNLVDPVFVNPAQSLVVARIGAEINPLQVVDIIEENIEPVHKLWDLETMGIDSDQPTPEDTITQDHFMETIEYHAGQYWVSLPWKLNTPDLPTNYRTARGQIYNLMNKLRQNPSHLMVYNKVIQDQLQNDFIEKVPGVVDHNIGHYLPHHDVRKDSVTTPIRVVFNCSSRASKDAPSLNDCLYTGPNLTEKLGDVLLKFRTKKYAFVADISKAFLRIGLKEADRDYTKFLWPENPNDPNSPLATYRFKSVLFGSCSSPFLLCSTLKYHFEKSLEHELVQAFYMDNLQGTTTSEADALKFYCKANSTCIQANMPLQSWNSNSVILRDQISHDYPNYEIPSQQSVLGLSWDVMNDRLGVKELKFPELKLTKRSLLSQVSMLFDPLGLLSPITIRGKCLIQEAWREKVSWDTPLDAKYIDEWEKIKAEYLLTHRLGIPRRFDTEEDDTKSQLHVFCDASSKAYGAVAYCLSNHECKLIMAKARVAPLKKRTLPQLELTAIEVGTRLAKYILNTVPLFEETFIWTDSEICLHWVAKNDSTIPYVRNRVGKITEIQSDFIFNHVSSKHNPADILSRGSTVSKLVKEQLWFCGPVWLTDKNEWPVQKSYQRDCPKDSTIMDPVLIPDCCFIDIDKYSSLDKLLNTTKLVFDFLKKRVNLDMPEPLKYWVKQIQKDKFAEEYKLLSDHRTKVNKLIRDLGLFLNEDDIICCRGRIEKADLPLLTRYPILLPKESHLTNLIIERSHHVTLHGGVADTLSHIRRTYWIPKGRQAVKKCLKMCPICRRYEARPMSYPGPPTLPSDRIQRGTPFEVTGVDFTGAITVTGEESPKKVYICLFTCASTRAVHLELADSMSAETFLHLFRRFAARRSCPRRMISDNGTNFVGASPVLMEILNSPKVQRALNARKCTWTFIAPRAPWQNGFTERMIGLVKNCLKKTLHKSKLTVEELRTIIVEIEARINNRPLTYLDDSSVSIEALTPAKLIQGRNVDTLPCIEFQEEVEDPTLDDPSHHLRIKYHNLNNTLNAWDRHWETDYLLSLRERFYGAQSARNNKLLKVGDVVILKTDQHRSHWPLAKVVSLHPDREGVIRIVKVLSKGQTSLRTIDKLVPLELSQAPREEDEDPTSVSTGSSHPTRAAALRSRDQWRGLIAEGHIT